MAKARAYLELTLEAYEASALLAFLRDNENLYAESLDVAGSEELTSIADALEEAIPQMSYVPPAGDHADDPGT